MTEFLIEYGLFLARVITVVAAIAFLMVVAFSLSRRARGGEKLEVKNLNDKYRAMRQILNGSVLSKKEFKRELKLEKSRLKADEKSRGRGDTGSRKRIYVLDFHGDIKATAVSSLREEITAILAVLRPNDEVLVRVENSGGLVHEHGLAATQLKRIRDRNIRLTVAVDKVAASGGYMMACVAERIIAAPFAVVGSIGVLAQIPNFHRLLEQHGIDFEQLKAGDLKRTLTMFGPNSEEDREHFREQLEDTHGLFKEFVAEHRPQLDIARVATGEHWFGSRARDLKLVDALQTSDDFLLEASENAELFEVTYTAGKRFSEKLMAAVQKGSHPFIPGLEFDPVAAVLKRN